MTDPSRDPARDLHRGPAGDPDANATWPSRRGTVPPARVGRGLVRHRRAVGWRSRDVVRAAALVMGMYLAVQLLWLAHVLFLTLFLGILFAIAISAGVDRLQRLRIPRGVGAALIVLTFFGALGGLSALMTPVLREQSGELRRKLPEAADRFQDFLQKRQAGVFGILIGGVGTDSGAPAPATASPAATPRPGAAATPDSALQTAPPDPLHERFRKMISGSSRFLFPFLTSTIAAVAGFLLIVFLSIYLSADPDLYRRGALALLPARRRLQGAEMMDRVAVVLRKWLVTQLIAMAVIGTVSTVALLILGVKAAFALGLLAGLFEFIPTVGPILSAVPAIAMGFLDSPEKALLVGAVYVGIQFLENHILIPLLMKGGMDLPPALTVLAQALLALVFGFLGLMVAVPLLATIMVIVQVLYVEKPADASAGGHDGQAGRFDAELDEPLEPLSAG